MFGIQAFSLNEWINETRFLPSGKLKRESNPLNLSGANAKQLNVATFNSMFDSKSNTEWRHNHKKRRLPFSDSSNVYTLLLWDLPSTCARKWTRNGNLEQTGGLLTVSAGRWAGAGGGLLSSFLNRFTEAQASLGSMYVHFRGLKQRGLFFLKKLTYGMGREVGGGNQDGEHM